MVLRRAATTVALFASLGCSASVVEAQGLAEAARQAEAQRRTSTRKSIVVKPANAANVSLGVIDEAAFVRYRSARLRLAALKRSDPDLDERLAERLAARPTFLEFALHLDRERAVVETIGTYGLTPVTYLQIEEEMYRFLTFDGTRQHGLSDRDKANRALLEKLRPFVERTHNDCYAAERGLRSYGTPRFQ